MTETDLDSPRSKTCPTCGSPDPQRHPAVQWEGEVQLCRDAWHAPYTSMIDADGLPLRDDGR